MFIYFLKPKPTYTLTRSATAVDEGYQFTITLYTTNTSDGATVPYTITGITSDDILSGQLTGNFTVTDNTATVSFVTREDQLTEGTETALLSLDGGLGEIAVEVSDTSISQTYVISKNVSPVDEGTQVTLTLQTTGVPANTSFPYTITGVSSADISGASLTGSFTTSGTYALATASFTLSIAADSITEGLETLTIALDGGQASTTVQINDTSVPSSVLGTLVDLKFESSLTNLGSQTEPLTIVGSTPLQYVTSAPVVGSGAGSARLASNNIQLPASANGNYTFGTNDFTIEVDYYLHSSWIGHINIIKSYGNSTLNWELTTGASNYNFNAHFSYGSSLSNWGGTGPYLDPIEYFTWTNFTICRKGDVIYGFRDGVYKGAVTLPAGYNMESPSGGAAPTLQIGDYIPNNYSGGALVDNVKITNGTAKYTQGVNFSSTHLERAGNLTHLGLNGTTTSAISVKRDTISKIAYASDGATGSSLAIPKDGKWYYWEATQSGTRAYLTTALQTQTQANAGTVVWGGVHSATTYRGMALRWHVDRFYIARIRHDGTVEFSGASGTTYIYAHAAVWFTNGTAGVDKVTILPYSWQHAFAVQFSSYSTAAAYQGVTVPLLG